MLVHIKDLVKKADRGGYALGAFNTINLETTMAIFSAAAETGRPLIIQISEATIAYAGLPGIIGLIKAVDAVFGRRVIATIHLDHGRHWSITKACIDAGLTSVHMDGSALPYNQNVAITKKAVAYGHKRGVWVQGELGSLLGHEGMVKAASIAERRKNMTDPNLAADFVKKTKVDTLAIAVGSMHGLFKGKEKIDFKRLTEINKKVKTPLVLHGASGLPDSDIKSAIGLGVRIINIDTVLRLAFTNTLRRSLKRQGGLCDPRKILAPAITAVTQETKKKIILFSK